MVVDEVFGRDGPDEFLVRPVPLLSIRSLSLCFQLIIFTGVANLDVG